MRLTKDDIREIDVWFDGWRSPADVLAYVGDWARKMRADPHGIPTDLFTQSGCPKLPDAHGCLSLRAAG